MTTSYQANEILKASITQFITLSDDECKNVFQLFYSRKLKKKEHWFEHGRICSEIIFVVKGCIRICYEKNNIERTIEFFFENSWYTDYESWLTKQPTTVCIEALESTELLIIPFPELERLYETHPKFERVGRLMAEKTIISICNRNLSLLNDSPEERYLQLLRDRPEVINRIPQHIIASYLGIEPETLSRIRRKISLKDRCLLVS